MELWIGLLIGIVVGAAVAAFITRAVMQPRVADTIAAAEVEVAEKRLAAEREAENVLRTSREAAQDIRLEADKAIDRRYQDLARAEERVDRRGANQDTQAKTLEQREQLLNKRQSRLDKRQNDLGDLEQEHRQKLEETCLLYTSPSPRD